MHLISFLNNYSTVLLNRAKFFGQLLKPVSLKLKNEPVAKYNLSELSHSFQTPLSVIQAHLESLKLKRGTEPEIKQIEKMVNDISVKAYCFINLTALENEQIEFNWQQINLSDLLNELAEQMQVVCEFNNIRFNCHIPKNIYIRADKEKLTEAVNNILNNAVKYISNDRLICLQVYVKQSIEIQIKDSGVGISQECLPKIFNKFYRVNNSILGSGLGLNIAKAIIEKHGGFITAESQLGKGSNFKILLPKNKPCD